MARKDLTYIWSKYVHPKNTYELDITVDGDLVVVNGLSKEPIAIFKPEVKVSHLKFFLEEVGFVDKYVFTIE